MPSSDKSTSSVTFRGCFDQSAARVITFGDDGDFNNFPASKSVAGLSHLKALVFSQYGCDLQSFSTVAQYRVCVPPMARDVSPVPIPPHLLSEMSYNVVLRAQVGCTTNYDIQYQKQGHFLGRLILMFKPQHALGSHVEKGSILFLVRKISLTPCPSPKGFCQECKMLVYSQCCSLVSITSDNSIDSFEIISASQFVSTAQLLRIHHHPNLFARNNLFHTIVHGDVLDFPEIGSLSRLSRIPPVPLQIVEEERGGVSKKRKVQQVIATPTAPASRLRITMQPEKRK